MAFLEMKNIAVMYQKGQRILENFNLQVERGTFLSLLGPSGCGKTTTLRTIAGFLAIQEGELFINGKLYNRVPTHRRNLGVVFQNYALFPHLSVFDNVAFGLKMRKVEPSERKKRVMKAIEIVGLKGFEERLPSRLSGGQQQRVGIARAVVIEPDVLLMDEPLSNLDANLRLEMRAEIRRIQKEIGITTIYVTHDQSEAIAMSDRVALLNSGRIEQLGMPQEIFYSPGTSFVAKFMGFQEIANGTVREISGGKCFVNTGETSLEVRSSSEISRGCKAVVFGRQKNLNLLKERSDNSLKGLVKAKIFQGDSVLYIVELGDQIQINSEVSVEQALWNEGDTVFIAIDRNLSIAFKREER